MKDLCNDRRLFMSSSMKAVIHLGPNFSDNLDVYKNTNFKEIQNLCNIIEKLVLDHSQEILNVHTTSLMDEIDMIS